MYTYNYIYIYIDMLLLLLLQNTVTVALSMDDVPDKKSVYQHQNLLQILGLNSSTCCDLAEPNDPHSSPHQKLFLPHYRFLLGS